MKERPILFSGPMVRAILTGKKIQTRRIVKPQPKDMPYPWPGWGNWKITERQDGAWSWWSGDHGDHGAPYESWSCPFGTVGDYLYVRETWNAVGPHPGSPYAGDEVYYRADYGDDSPCPVDAKWRPSIHMPRWASRLTLEITGVRVERLKDISEEDALDEGVDLNGDRHVIPTRLRFAKLWNSINAARGFGWEANPWVWVVSFKKVENV